MIEIHRIEPEPCAPIFNLKEKAMSGAFILGQDASVENGEVTLYKIHMPAYLQGFLIDIDRMNAMYELPAPECSQLGYAERLENFKSILSEECTEIEDVIQLNATTTGPEIALEVRVQLADLLGDIIVFCASEAKRWDIPIDRVLNVIMQSNFSKLDANGKPIKDERGKFLKGPHYWKPEPKIAELLIEWNGRSE